MNKKLIAAVAVVVLLAGGVAVFASVNSNSNNDSQSAESVPRQDQGDSRQMQDMDMPDQSGAAGSGNTDGTNQAGSEATAASEVTISNFAFAPVNITVKAGTTVTWTNNDSVRHDVAMDGGGEGPKSQLLGKGESYSYTFEKAGTYNYLCTPHPYMKGTVTVTD